MFTWNVYYEEYQRRQTLLAEARQYRLIKAVVNNKNSQVRKSPIGIQTEQNAIIKDLSFEHK